ncbi:hypothetical protein ACFLS9_03480 [Bacteroidota bacterium]
MYRILIIGVLLTGLFLSCNNKDTTTPTEEQGNVNKGFDNDGDRGDRDGEGDKDRDGDREKCFEFVYPITFIMPDGSTITGDDREEIGLALRAWYEDHPNLMGRPTLEYPVDIVYPDGTIKTLNNDEELKTARKACEDKEGDRDGDRGKCFEFVYPITYIMPDGTTITIQSEDDIDSKTAIRAWYGDHPDSREKPTLNYPVDVILEDGSTVTISNDEEMDELRAGCGDGDKDGGGRP